MLTSRRLEEEPEGGPWSRQDLHAAIRARIGQVLQARYQAPRQLPHQLLVLVMQLDEAGGADVVRKRRPSKKNKAARGTGRPDRR